MAGHARQFVRPGGPGARRILGRVARAGSARTDCARAGPARTVSARAESARNGGARAESTRADSLTAGRSRSLPRWLKVFLPLMCAVGCSPAPQHRLVNVWAMGREGEVIAQLLPQFRQLHPDIEVRIQQLPWTAAHQKLLTGF